MNGEEGPTNPKSLVAFTNILRKLFEQASTTCPYSERLQIARIRIMLPFFVQNYLNELELRNGSPIQRFKMLLPLLTSQDVLFKQNNNNFNRKQTTQNSAASGSKRTINDAMQGITTCNAILPTRGKFNLDNREPMHCTFCNKQGHLAATCWSKFPDKKKEFHAKGKSPAAPYTPLQSLVTEEQIKNQLFKFYKTLPPPDPSN